MIEGTAPPTEDLAALRRGLAKVRAEIEAEASGAAEKASRREWGLRPLAGIVPSAAERARIAEAAALRRHLREAHGDPCRGLSGLGRGDLLEIHEEYDCDWRARGGI